MKERVIEKTHFHSSPQKHSVCVLERGLTLFQTSYFHRFPEKDGQFQRIIPKKRHHWPKPRLFSFSCPQLLKIIINGCKDLNNIEPSTVGSCRIPISRKPQPSSSLVCVVRYSYENIVMSFLRRSGNPRTVTRPQAQSAGAEMSSPAKKVGRGGEGGHRQKNLLANKKK